MVIMVTRNHQIEIIINNPYHESCPARPASWFLDNGRLNLVLLGAELLASGLQAQVHLGHDDDGDAKKT